MKKKRYQKEIKREIKQIRVQAKSKLFGVVYSRTAIILLLLLVQAAFFGVLLYYLESYGPMMYALTITVSVSVVIYLMNEIGNVEFKLTWLFFILSVPVVGAGFYLLNKTELGNRYNRTRLKELWHETEVYKPQNTEIVDIMRSGRQAHSILSNFLYNRVGFPTYGNTEATYFSLGDEMFPALLDEINRAEHYIFMEYFIITEGLMWDTILRVLQKKAQQGVEVRVMYDGMCSIANLPYDYLNRLRELGINCKQYAPLVPILSTSQNNRDHRKICVVDGKVAFTGGVNLADEYINQKRRFGHWKDCGIMLKGDAVNSFTIMFLQMWNVSERRKENYAKYLTPQKNGFRRKLGFMIPYGDCPYDREDVGKEVYLHILNHAKKYVHIMTPYLILDSEMSTALCRAAKSGVEVQLIMPYIPDKKYAFYLAKTYYSELLKSGVQIFEYTPGFVHSKLFVSDDDTATVGTVNLDYRSLYLHFECGVFIYHNPVVHDIERDFQETLRKCHKVTLLEVKNRSFFVKLYGQVLRLIAPLM